MGMLEQRAGLEGKTAVVLGGGGGIGAAVTLALAGAGVDLAICDIDATAMATTVDAVKALGRHCIAQHLDVTAAGALPGFYAAIGREFDGLNIVVNVVGGVRQRAFMESTAEEDAGDIRRNYGYVIESIRLAVPLIERSGRGGSIINFTTIEAHRGAAGFAVYAGAKAATSNITRALAVEFGAKRIRVNAIATDTTPSGGNARALRPELTAVMETLTPAHFAQAMALYIPLGSAPGTDDLANAVLFLASDLAAFVSGVTIHVDGGTAAAMGFLNWPYGDGYAPTPVGISAQRLFDDIVNEKK
jgi:NAD(P)-dependent dehydrogenase (short-subunit alcohol dehydrogenase family)